MAKKQNGAKEFFFNPNDPESGQQLARLLSQAILYLAAVYGQEETQPEVTEFVTGTGGSNQLVDTLRKLLKKESETRLFDTKFMGQIHPQGNMIAIIAKTVAGFMNNNSIVREVSPVETELEYEVCEKIARWFGYNPETFAGNITTGGTSANLNALWVARERAKAQGKKGPYYILTSEMRHYSIDKTADLLGEGVETMLVPMNGFKIDYEALEKTIAKIQTEGGGTVMAVIGIAGETETGEIDDIERLADITQQHGVYLHIDAAYGGPFILSRAKKHFAGIHRADSITIDPHKMMYTPYSAGIVLFKQRRDQMLIEATMRDNARYLVKTDATSDHTNEDRDLGMARVEGSMGVEGALMTWATLELLGEEGLAQILNHTLDLTQHAYKHVQKSEVLRAIHEPMINTLLIGLEMDLETQAYNSLIEDMRAQADAQGYYISVNHDVDAGKHALRLVPMHPHTKKKDVTKLLRHLERAAISKLAS